ncbi:MAG: hypothetical protein KAU27_11760, partial [Desulfuromonadales bacterium]|nr:hypothetical protein [Desulfuromonadales bacterium]
MLRWILLLSLLLSQTACDSTVDTERPNASLLHAIEQNQNEAVTERPIFESLVATELLNEPT